MDAHQIPPLDTPHMPPPSQPLYTQPYLRPSGERLFTHIHVRRTKGLRRARQVHIPRRLTLQDTTDANGDLCSAQWIHYCPGLKLARLKLEDGPGLRYDPQLHPRPIKLRRLKLEDGPRVHPRRLKLEDCHPRRLKFDNGPGLCNASSWKTAIRDAASSHTVQDSARDARSQTCFF